VSGLSRSSRRAAAAAAGSDCCCIDDGDAALPRQLGKEHPRQGGGPRESRLIGLAQHHPRRRVEHEGRRHRRLAVGQPAGPPEHGPRERERHERHSRHPQKQQQQMIELQAAAVGDRPLLQKPQRRKVVGHRLPPHHQMQQHRHRHGCRAGEQERRQE